MSYFVLGQSFPLDTNTVDVYTSNASNGTVISTLGVTNTSSSTVTARVFLRRTYNAYSGGTMNLWSTRTSGFGTNQISALTFGNNLFVAGGVSGTMTVSVDGMNWVSRTSGFGSTAINALTFGNNLYIAGGASGTMTTSPDGVTWTSRTSGFSTNAINALTYGKSLYVAGGAAGTLTTSTDGITWTARTSNFGANAINGLAFGLGQFTAAGSSMDTGAYNSGLYVAVGAAGTLATSTDGITWTTRTSGFSTNAINAVAFGSNIGMRLNSGTGVNQTAEHATGLFVAVGAAGVITTSSDGINWTARTSGVSTALSSVIFANNLWVVTTTGGNFLLSSDGITWTSVSTSVSQSLLASTFGNGRFILAGASGSMTMNPQYFPAASKQTALFWDIPFAANSYTPITVGMTLALRDILTIQSSVPATLNFTVFGSEN